MVRRHAFVLLAVVAMAACTLGVHSSVHAPGRQNMGDATAALNRTGGLEPAVQAVRGTEGEQVLRLTGLVLVAVLAVAAVAAEARRRFLGWTDTAPVPGLAFGRVTPARAPPRLRLLAS